MAPIQNKSVIGIIPVLGRFNHLLVVLLVVEQRIRNPHQLTLLQCQTLQLDR
jgi:hypothetical protein